MKKRRGRRTRGQRGTEKRKGKEESMSVVADCVDLGGLSSQLQQHWQQ